MLQNIPDDRGPSTSVHHTEQALRLGIDQEWVTFLDLDCFEISRLAHVTSSVENDRATTVVYPATDNVHRWSRACKPGDVRVVVVGQDPYHDGSASGLAFGTVPGGKIPPSLHNIFKELCRSVPDFRMPAHGCLDQWCSEGVLLLNSVFTVIRGKPGSHDTLGWNILSDKVIRKLSEKRDRIVFMLWGRNAQDKEYLINQTKHLILKSSHPSPRVVCSKTPFLGNGHFVKANEYLVRHGHPAVNWNIINTQV